MVRRLQFILAVAMLTGVTTAFRVLDGDVMVEGVQSYYVNADDGTCSSEVEPETLQEVEAIKWVFRLLNEDSFIPGVTIGFNVRPKCRAQDVREIAFSIAKDVRNLNIFGVLGPTFSSAAQYMSRILGSLPDADRLPQIGYSTTATLLSDRQLYPNFFRTVPRDSLRIQTMLKMMESLGWTYVAVIHDDDTYANEGKDELMADGKARGICFPETIAVNPAFDSNTTIQVARAFLVAIFHRSKPITGLIVFGASRLRHSVIDAAKEIMDTDQSYRPPSMMLSNNLQFAWLAKSFSFSAAQGSISVVPYNRQNATQFGDYWRGIFKDRDLLLREISSNPGLGDAFYAIAQCNVTNTSCQMLNDSQITTFLPQGPYVFNAIQAALVLAETMKQLHEQKCSSGNGPCNEFINMPRSEVIDKMHWNTFDFDTIGNFRIKEPPLTFQDRADPTYKSFTTVFECHNLTCASSENALCPEKVADLEFMSIDMDPTFQAFLNNYDRSSAPQCPLSTRCSECALRQDGPYKVHEGDLYIIGIAPVHDIGSLLQCGAIKRGGVDSATTFEFAVSDREAKSPDSTPEASVGVITIDSCNDAQLIQERVLSVIRDGVYVGERHIDLTDKVLGVVGSWVSDVSIAVAEVLNRLHYVQISYASTSPRLSNRTVFPYFTRVTSSDVKQAEQMLKIVQELEAENVQVLFSETAYGTGGKDALVEHASSYDVCISNTIGVSQFNPDYTTIQSQLDQYPQAKVVLLFLSSFDVVRLLPILDAMQGFTFIASEGWGNRNEIEGLQNLVGTITFANELPVNDKFKDYLKNIPFAKDTDKWIIENMQQYFQCYAYWSFDKTRYRQECRGPMSMDPYDGYQVETWVPFIQLAVKALLSASRKALVELCGNSTRICPEFRGQPGVLVRHLKEETIEDGKVRENIFDANGDGLANYKVYVISRARDGSLEYVAYKKNEYAAISDKDITSSCAERGSCWMCSPSSGPPPQDNAVRDLSIALGIFVTLFVIATVCFFLLLIFKTTFCRKNDPTYLTPLGEREESFIKDSPPDGCSGDSHTMDKYTEPPTASGNPLAGLRSSSENTGFDSDQL